MADLISVFLADDHETSRDGMRYAVAELAPDMRVVGEAGALNDAIWQVLKLRPNILLLDVNWYGNDDAGLEAIRRLRSEAPDTRIIAITAHQHLVKPAHDAGAHGAVTKHIHRRELIEEIRSVHALPLQAKPAQDEEVHEALSERELEVLRLMAPGHIDREIAATLIISEATVKGHVRSIIAKLHAGNRTSAIHAAYRLRIIPPP